MLFTSEFTLPKSNFYCLSFSFDYLICRSSYLSEEKLTETLSSLRGYQWENHAKGATVHITELAQTFHIGITWWSIGRYGISFVQASFFSFFRGGTLEQLNLHWNMNKFCNFLNDNISGKLYSNPGETKFSQSTKYTLLNDDNVISVTLLY